LPATKDTLYTVPVGASVYVKAVRLFNHGGAAETVQLYANLSGTSRNLPTIIIDPGESAIVDSLGLGDGAVLEGESSSATTVDYFVDIVVEN
jgi:hypothetical protein